MSNRAVISTPDAPEAIGPYSQAIKVGNTVWLSGQIPLVPGSMELVSGDISAQARQVFSNLAAVAEAAGGSLTDRFGEPTHEHETAISTNRLLHDVVLAELGA